MSNLFLRSTDGLDTDNGTTWALAKATLAGIDAIELAGDTVFVSQVHAETTAAAVTYTFAGTVGNPTKIICGNDAAEPPTTTTTGASVSTSGASNIRVIGSAYLQGIAFSCGSAAQNFANPSFNYSGIAHQHYNACDLFLIDQHPSSIMTFGSNAGGDSSRTTLQNCRIKLSNAAQSITYNGLLRVVGGSFVAGTVSPTAGVFSLAASGPSCDATIENFDLSALAAGTHLLLPPAAGGARTGIARFRNCKMPAAWTGNLVAGTISNPNFRAEMYNCDSGATNYRLWIEDYTGTIKHETTLVKTGGASDGTTTLAWKMASNANTNEYAGALRSGEIAVWNDTIGSAKTVTVDILRDSASGLTDAEVWIDVEYQGTTGNPMGVEVSSKRATVLTTAATITASTATWTTTGMTAPNRQKMSVTFTPQQKGPIIVRVYFAKPSATVYVDPTAQVS